MLRRRTVSRHRAVLGAVSGIALLAILVVLLTACGDAPDKTPTPIPGPPPSHQAIYNEPNALNIGLLPLNRHTDNFYSTRQPNGAISIDTFGPAHQLDAVELTYRVKDAIAEDVVRSLIALMESMVPDQVQEALKWVSKEIEGLGPENKKIQTRVGTMYLTLYHLPPNSVVVSIDRERL